MLHITKDTELTVLSNGKRSTLSAKWWKSRMGGKLNLLDPNCHSTNVLLDAHSMEPLKLKEGGRVQMVRIETNYSPQVNMRLIFCAPIGARLLRFDGSFIEVTGADLIGAQLRGEHGMYCVVAARKVERDTYLTNATALAGVLVVAGPSNPNPWPPPADPTKDDELDYNDDPDDGDDDDDDDEDGDEENDDEF